MLATPRSVAARITTLIDESEALQCQAAEVTRVQLQKQLPGLRVGLIHGRLPREERDRVMGAFATAALDLLVATTVIEVCSEGSTPIAADLMNRAGAPGNSFTFLMAGVATDYTEIMSIRDTTSSWRIALALPLVTVPQVILIGFVLNTL